jgi:UDP-N-acetyl-D-glucosamine/UDP-N-acetyl-D-galactosamine dehydrogenase
MIEKLCIVGLGYVGLPLLVGLSQYFDVVGYEKDIAKVLNLKLGRDYTGELTEEQCMQLKNIQIVDKVSEVRECSIFIITVPTPVSGDKLPDLSMVLEASNEIGSILRKSNIVCYESTVYPGATEGECIPLLENASGLTFIKDFTIGYSPERINPGDTKNILKSVKKLLGASDPDTLSRLSLVYGSIVEAGLHLTPSIQVAEASKILENTQRDVNIALMNECSRIFNKLGINFEDVLDAAKTKWNFLPFYPGLVGGHCIGVDPYYLIHKARLVGINPELISAARAVNEFVVEDIIIRLIQLADTMELSIRGAKVLILGCTFKENCADIRNSKSLDLGNRLTQMGADTVFFDPIVNSEVPDHKVIKSWSSLKKLKFDIIVSAVAHDMIAAMSDSEFRSVGHQDTIYFTIRRTYSTLIETAGM